MTRRRDGWGEVPAWAFDIIELQFITISQNEAILAALEKRANRLSPQDQRDVDTIFEVATGIKKKIDEAQQS